MASMIIGLTGSYGAGKGAVVKYLVEQKGFRHFSAREFIKVEIEKRGLLINRDSLIEVANDLRQKYGATYIVESLLKMAKEDGGNAVVESLRATAEAVYIKENGGFVIGVDADPQLRYKRAIGRGTETDNVTFAEWEKQQEVETNPDDPTKQDIFGALAESNEVIQNNGTLGELSEEIDRVVGGIL